MPPLEQDIALGRSFASLEERLYIQLLRTHSVTTQQINRVYASADLTHSQYNALRILRGSRAGLTCDDIASRMVAVDSDVTRILSGLHSRRMIVRSRAKHDGRAVINRITEQGLTILSGLDAAVDDAIRKIFGVLSQDEIRATTAGLAKLAER
jgi:DNA-binding MarR family transcriptional regulator